MNNYSSQPEKHKAFVSFHSDDEAYKIDFENRFANDFISVSIDRGDIDPDNSDDYIKRLIQQENIVQSSVVFALYGANTRKRKHVDWEISGGLNGKVGGHKGLVIILLPTFPIKPFNYLNQYDETMLYSYLHPRTAANVKSRYADVYFWPGMYSHLPSVQIKDVIETAFSKRDSHSHLIDNSHPQYINNLP
jgi:hypothetical protein